MNWIAIEGRGCDHFRALKKTTTMLIQDGRDLDRDLKPGPQECEDGMLTTRPRH